MDPVRRLFGWMAGLAGVAALARLLSRRTPTHHAPGPPEADPAQALREKLDEARTQPPEGPRPADPAETSETLEERRARVHAKAQEAIDAMQEPDRPA